MTYRELMIKLQAMTVEQLNCDVTVYRRDNHEFYEALYGVSFQNGDDVLHHTHPYIEIMNSQ